MDCRNEYNIGNEVMLISIALQDLSLAQNAATATKTPTMLGSLAHQIYRMMTNSGYDVKDFSSVFQFIRQQQGK